MDVQTVPCGQLTFLLSIEQTLEMWDLACPENVRKMQGGARQAEQEQMRAEDRAGCPLLNQIRAEVTVKRKGM